MHYRHFFRYRLTLIQIKSRKQVIIELLFCTPHFFSLFLRQNSIVAFLPYFLFQSFSLIFIYELKVSNICTAWLLFS